MAKLSLKTLKLFSFSDIELIYKVLSKDKYNKKHLFPKKLLKKIPHRRNHDLFFKKIKKELRHCIYIPSTKKTILAPQGRGSFASYYKINSKLGIKIIEKEYSSKELMKSSRNWKHAKIELKLQKKAHQKYPLIAYGYKVIPVKTPAGKWKIGILLEHCEGKNLEKTSKKHVLGKKFIINRTIIKVKVKKDLLTHIDRILRANQIYHNDLNPSNVIIQGNKVKVIDFGCATQRPQKSVHRYGSKVFSLIY